MEPTPKTGNGRSPEEPVQAARILVIDNREQVRRDLKRGLEAPGYRVEVVTGDGEVLYQNALRVARKFRPHVAIVDLRLGDDYDTSDTTGLKLLQELRARGDGVRLIAYSAYLNATVDRSISELGATWVDKSDAPQVLKGMVEKLAEQSCAWSRSFTVTWPRNWRRSRTLWKLFGKDIPPSLLDDVIALLFERGRRVWVYHIEEKDTPSASPVSRGRSLVIKVQPPGGITKKIVKVSTPGRVHREVNRYQRYIQDRMPGQFHTRLEVSRTFWDIGASMYSFLGDDDSPMRTFRNFYAEQADVQTLLEPLRFWRRLWAGHHRPRRGARQSIVSQYARMLDLKRNCERVAQQQLPLFVSEGVSDPLQWLREHGRDLHGSGLRQVVHGDFHADNLFTDGAHVWLVDFERTGVGPLYADFCELEIDTLTRLLPPTVSDAEYLSLAQALLAFEDPPPPRELSQDGAKALHFVRGLRELAFQTTGRRFLIDYQIGLLCDALFVTGMRPSANAAHEQAVQRNRAWLYASLLCAHLQAGQPPEKNPQ